MAGIGDGDFIGLLSGSAATRRRLTGVARGGVLAIARHSLRGGSWAMAGAAHAPSNAKMAKSDRGMQGCLR
jgi:hypothetical protein